MNALQIKLKLGDDTPAHWFDVDSIDFFNDRVCFVDCVGESIDIEYQCEPLRFAPPSLTDDQQVVLDYLKKMCPPKLGVSAMVTTYCLVDDNINDNWQEYSDEIPEHIEALQKLSVSEENQVLAAFANYGLEGEE